MKRVEFNTPSEDGRPARTLQLNVSVDDEEFTRVEVAIAHCSLSELWTC
jgi:hypothetical protein